MTRELPTQKTTAAPHSVGLKVGNEVDIEKINLKETETRLISEDRFKRYKRSLQKRARSIL